MLSLGVSFQAENFHYSRGSIRVIHEVKMNVEIFHKMAHIHTCDKKTAKK